MFLGFQDLDENMCRKPVYLRVKRMKTVVSGLIFFSATDPLMENQSQDIHMEGGPMLISDRGNPAHLEAWLGEQPSR
jgi:hypothetical protein